MMMITGVSVKPVEWFPPVFECTILSVVVVVVGVVVVMVPVMAVVVVTSSSQSFRRGCRGGGDIADGGGYGGGVDRGGNVDFSTCHVDSWEYRLEFSRTSKTPGHQRARCGNTLVGDAGD